ncbi:MAG: MtaA/CmuA family methyltransferase [Euryarchaeota archaeon]|nr:MtaA/CmuA family methyltransferase [Euryarchaeota archaeon]
MKARERFLKVLAGEAVERPPVLAASSTATLEQMDRAGASFPQAHRDADLMARLASEALALGLEGVGVPFCQTVELEVLGCEIDFGSDRSAIPGVAKTFPGFAAAAEVRVPENLLKKGRIPVVLRALVLLKERHGDVPVIGHVRGPFSVASRLKGLDKMVMMMLEDPQKVTEFVEATSAVTVEYAGAMFDHGADAVTIEEMAAAGNILGPDLFQQFVVPSLTEVIKGLKGPAILHICGSSENILEGMVSTGAKVLSIDRKTDAKRAKEIVKGRAALMGNIDAARTLGYEGPEAVRRETLEALEAGLNIIAPGCLLSPITSSESIRAMVEAVVGYGK